MNSYDDVGHLSPDRASTVAAIRRSSAVQLKNFDGVNRLAMKVLRGGLAKGGPAPFVGRLSAVVGIFVAIVIRRCQAAVLLAEHGLAQEANTLTRAALEHTFVLGSLLADPERCLVDLDADDIHHKRKLLNLVAKQPEVKDVLGLAALATFKEAFAAYETLPQGVALRLKEHAEYAGYHFEYASLYAQLSMSSAHPTNTVLSSHSDWSGDKPRIDFGPSADVGAQIEHATAVLLMALERVGKVYDLADLNRDVSKLGDAFEEDFKARAHRGAGSESPKHSR